MIVLFFTVDYQLSTIDYQRVEKISHYCQKCRAANEPGTMNCWRCGTTLMIVVYPPSVQHEEMVIPTYYEDHLLERVSLLELRLTQMTEKLSLALELMLKQSSTIQSDHTLVKSILEILESNGIANINRAERSNVITKHEFDEINKVGKTERKIEEIIAVHHTPNAELFIHLVKEGMRLLERSEEKQAFQMLDRAALLSPENIPLFLFIAENLFRAEKVAEAQKFLEKAYKIEPANPNVLLLLGAIYADAGKAEKSRRLLSLLANNPKFETIVNYIWGILAALEENWEEAIAAFRTALKTDESPELEYLIACCYLQIKSSKKAQTFLISATKKDTNFADAWFMSGIADANKKSADEAMKKAQTAKDSGAQCLEFLKGKKAYAAETALPFAHFKKENLHLLTKGSLRLVKFFKARIFEALN